MSLGNDDRPCAAHNRKDCPCLNNCLVKSGTELSAIMQTTAGQTQPTKAEAPVSVFPEAKEK